MMIAFLLVFAVQANAQSNRYGIVNQKAPSLGVTEWRNLPEDLDTLDINDLHGKVVYLYGFQNW